MTSTNVHELKLRLWKLPPKQRTVLLSDLEAALTLAPGEAQDAALAKIAQAVSRAEVAREKKLARKEKAVQDAEQKLRQEIGL
ncbi:MAG: hypothetical protein AB7O21_08145 [Gammaproteobacteria bacterium]